MCSDKNESFSCQKKKRKFFFHKINRQVANPVIKLQKLTEIQELLHGQRRRGELGEMVDVFGHVGQCRSLHQGPNTLHLTAHPHSPAVSDDEVQGAGEAAAPSVCSPALGALTS